MKKIINFLSLGILLACLAVSLDAYAQPANDECVNAIDISASFDGTCGIANLVGPFDNTGGTSGANDPAEPGDDTACPGLGTPNLFGDAATIFEKSIWYSFVVPDLNGDGSPVSYSLWTSDGSYGDCGLNPNNILAGDADTQVAIYEGPNCPDASTGACDYYAANEDLFGTPPWISGWLSLQFTPGVTYYMVMDSWDAVEGEICLAVVPCGSVCGDGEAAPVEEYCDCVEDFVNEPCPAAEIYGINETDNGNFISDDWSGNTWRCQDDGTVWLTIGAADDNCTDTGLDMPVDLSIGSILGSDPDGMDTIATGYYTFIELTQADLAVGQITITSTQPDGLGNICNEVVTLNFADLGIVCDVACAAGDVDPAIVNQTVCEDGTIQLCADGTEDLTLPCGSDDGSPFQYGWQVTGDVYGMPFQLTDFILQSSACETIPVADLLVDQFGYSPPDFTPGAPLPPGTYTLQGAAFCVNSDGTTVLACGAPTIMTVTLDPAGTCPTDIAGCLDPCDPNYDMDATVNDPTLCAGYSTDCNADCTAGPFGGTWDAATCGCINETTPVLGCTDAAFCEYNPAADCDDGTCVTPTTDPGCDDGDCTNGVETWDATTCTCVAGTPPVDPGCDDGDCTNGVETWDGCDCVAGTPPVDPGCDDGDCTNGVETWDGCDCIAGTPPVDPGCDDGDCSNGVETWDGCDCVAGTPPVDPGCDDGDCANGLETWDGCACVSNPPSGVTGCTDPAFCEYDPNADCDDGSCATSNADPGCDDGDCTNGTETWDMTACNCVPGTPPVDPGCDDGDCSNGVETWDGCDCVAGTPPVDPGCDDGDCANGLETWDGCACVSNPPSGVTGCTDPAFCEYDPNADCDDGSCATAAPTAATIAGGPFQFCAGDGTPDFVSGITTMGGTGTNSAWVITDDQLNILGLPGMPGDVDFDGAGFGTCLIWYVTFEDIVGAEMGMNAADLTGCFALSNSIEVVREDCMDPCSATAATISGGPFEFCAGDGMPDFVSGITTTGGSGANSAWVITDDALNILALPNMPGEVDFDGAGFGTCLIWYVTFDDIAGAEVGMNAADLTGCFALSNSIEVVREDCGGPCEDEISGNIAADMGCDVSGTAVLITDAAGNPVGPGMAIADANGDYTLSGGPYACGEYIATLDVASIPACYADAGGDVGPSGFTVNGDGTADGADFSAFDEVPTLSQWGLMTLALLLMTFGALKLGFINNVQTSTNRRK